MFRSATTRAALPASSPRTPLRTWLRALALPAVVSLLLSGLAVVAVPVTTAAADPVPVQQRTSGVVTADSLPTTQINGVAWAQQIVGNTVYVGGSFTAARPAGAALGVNESTRNNLLAYDLTTGELITSFAPSMNAAVRALAASPDGTKLYVGGTFTSSDGIARYRLAAYSTANGALIATFNPGVDYTVNSLVATASTLYVGGSFTTGGGQPRSRLAAFNATTGALTGWAPVADGTVQTMVMSPDGSKVIIGGAFLSLNGVSSIGIGAVDAVTGALVQPWNTNLLVHNGGPNAAILALSSDGTWIYGGGYKYGVAGALEGMFKIDPNDGTVQWIEDCHGDTYGVYVNAAAVYQVGHAHYCGNDLGWAQPPVWNFNRGIAFTKNATGTLTRDPIGGGYANFAGVPSPSLLSWFPRLDAGAITGKTQAAWTITGNSNYVVLGGEFPLVNNGAQQGLARFAVQPIAPAKQGPRLSGASYVPTVVSSSAGTVRLSTIANWDRDDRTLTYRVQRSSYPATSYATIATRTVDSSEWDRPALGYVDQGLTPGQTYTYRIQVNDADGNNATSGTATIVVAGSGGISTYGQTVLDQGASLYWPLNDAAGLAKDYAGFNDGILNTGVTRGAAGAIAGDSAMTFSGAVNGDLVSSGTMAATDTFTIEAWFQTTNTKGGRILGFSDLPVGTSAHRDRQIYLSNTGKVSFGVYSDAANAVTSTKSYNDGVWHQAVATLGPNGMALYVDGLRVGQRSDVTYGEKYLGYWRVGGEGIGGWNNAGSNGWLAGSIDEVSVYPAALTFQQINAQYLASGRASVITPSPTDTYGALIYADEPTAYWRLAEASGLTAVDAGPGGTVGGYQLGTTKNAAGALIGTPNTAVTFNGTSGFISSNTTFVNPTAYSEEAWFKTTTTSGGTIIGFGTARTGLSATSDRQVYLQNDGKVAFRAAGSTPAAVVSAIPYNDGQWHHVVATQGGTGMVLYVDGVQVGSDPTTTSGNYTGYWRVGADANGSSTSAYFGGTLDEAAIYATVLSAAKVQQRYTLGHGSAPNTAPTASFTSTIADLTVALDGTGSADPDGTVTGYTWNFGDSTTATGASASHTYLAAGTYTVTLTVVDNLGASAVKTAQVTVIAANVPPTAAFTASPAYLSVAFDGSSSTDPDGTITGYSWDFGDGTGATGPAATHQFAAAGTYVVTLTVLDNRGASATSSNDVTVVLPPNTPPTAVIASSVVGLDVAVNGSASTDPDGTVALYGWDFGDGTVLTGSTEPTAVHTYAAAGSYLITLTVTDNEGSTGTATASRTVAPIIASDVFARTVASGWGSATIGGAWTMSAGTPVSTVANGVGLLPLGAGVTRTATLAQVAQSNVDLRVTITADKAPVGGSTMVSAVVRKTSSGEYRLTAVFGTSGKVNLQLNRVVGSTTTQLAVATIANLTYVGGTDINLRLLVTTTSETATLLQGKGWVSGAAEPAAWTVTATDNQATAAGVLPAGGLGLVGYVSSAATNAPVTVSVRALSVQDAASA